MWARRIAALAPPGAAGSGVLRPSGRAVAALQKLLQIRPERRPEIRPLQRQVDGGLQEFELVAGVVTPSLELQREQLAFGGDLLHPVSQPDLTTLPRRR